MRENVGKSSIVELLGKRLVHDCGSNTLNEHWQLSQLLLLKSDMASQFAGREQLNATHSARTPLSSITLVHFAVSLSM
jgi:hypothetical protein